MNTKKFYLTTTLPYVNALPHIGHTLEFIQADVIVRYQRTKRGKGNVWFNVGTDEHGLKNYQKAVELGKSPKEYVDELAAQWKEFCALFNISYDTFYRTSEPYHVKPAQAFWSASDANGDIYKKQYEGYYCVGCEEFKIEKDLINGKCPVHQKEPVWTTEENYFFKLSKYKEELLSWLDSNPDVLKPAKRFQELRNWISNMEDISISRNKENLLWGIDVPNDFQQVMYVWFDALTNYINVLGYGEDDKKDEMNEWWADSVQIFGVDNLRFQCAIWQSMLRSANLPHTAKLLCHGFVLAEDGTKMSKSIGNVVDPFEQQEKYGTEALRFYLITGIGTYSDAPYVEADVVNIYNAYLADNFGNLLNRVIHLANKKEVKLNNFEKIDTNLKSKVDDFVKQINDLYSDYELSLASQKINELASLGNEYITENEPWAKDKDQEEVEKILVSLSYLLQNVIDLYEPIIPNAISKARNMLENQKVGVLFEKFSN